MEKEITLYEALTGLDFVLTHLDGRKIRIRNTPGQVIKPESQFTVEKLGMPFHKRSYEHGNLIIQFKIKFPNTIDAKSSKLLTDALQGSGAAPQTKGKQGEANPSAEDVAETCELKQFKETDRNTDHRGGAAGEHRNSDGEEDEDEEGGHPRGQQMGCQAQ